MKPLATVDDLQARGISGDDVRLHAFLEAASSSVRHAAHHPISRETATISLPATSSPWLMLPTLVVSVERVELDGEEITDWKLIRSKGCLWRPAGWVTCTPADWDVTLTAGYEDVPADIVDLVCSMVGYAMAEAEGGGYARRSDLISFRIDDMSEQYAHPNASTKAGPMELPEATKADLRARFGGGAAVVRMR